MEAHQPLEVGGVQETRQFTIAASGKAFRNLMDGLYSRKIEAFCREILTNAYDSHCEAGTPDLLFEVRVPTIFDKRLKVRDFGVGMSHEQVMDRYSTLFDSTKDQSDELVGMLGLGSKSPFAYTDGFGVRCWDGAEVRTYLVNLGPGGVPQISLAARAPSEERRGVEISIPVAKEDWPALEEALARVCLGFPCPPELPAQIAERMKFEAKLWGKGWAVGKCEALEYGMWARQGCVLYPIPSHVYGKVEGWEDVNLLADGKSGSRMVVDFPLGSLEVTPSRETLSFTDKTKEAVSEVLGRVRDELVEEYADHFRECKSDWEIALAYEKLGDSQNAFKMLGTGPQRRIHLMVRDTVSQTLVLRRRSGQMYRWAYVRLGDHSGSVATKTIYTDDGDVVPDYSVSNQADRYNPVRPKLAGNQFSTDRGPLTFIVDVESDNRRIAHYLVRNGLKRALVLRKPQSPPGDFVNEINGKEVVRKWDSVTEADLLALPIVKSLGSPPFVSGATLSKPPRPKVRREGIEAGKVLESDGQWRKVYKRELTALAATHEAFFYSQTRGYTLRPSALTTADGWRSEFSLKSGSFLELLERYRRVLGRSPKLLLVRVTPKTKWDDVRHFKPVTPWEDVLVHNSQPELWRNAALQMLVEADATDYTYSSEVKRKLIPHMLRCPSRGMRDLARLWSEDLDFCEKHYNFNSHTVDALNRKRLEEWKVKYYPLPPDKRPRKPRRLDFFEIRKALDSRINDHALIADALPKSDAVRRRLLAEVESMGYRLAPWGVEQSRDLVSPRWRRFLRCVRDVVQNMSAKDTEHYYRAMELAELECQRNGGRL